MYSDGLGKNYKPMVSWLPEKVPYDSDWDKYSKLLYVEYKQTYRNGVPLIFRGKPVIAPAQPKFNGKSESFWHIIGGKDNIPDVARCERIRWARAIIEHCGCEEVLVFSERRGRVNNTLLWLKECKYLVVLEERKNYFILRTAYVADRKHKIKTLEDLYQQSQQK